ncbi:unnamed protein product [Angiostrongylus costaricensis]|uniref:Secreted protein n=1 Tax=Angiostrongylus costaricensis TaxID=334426 RepID=A0A0R3Q1W3_ANGCS|nr:unnamed protein product [Angiostrongylus costaricensis]
MVEVTLRQKIYGLADLLLVGVFVFRQAKCCSIHHQRNGISDLGSENHWDDVSKPLYFTQITLPLKISVS